MTFVWILVSTFVVSVISLVGIFSLMIKENLLQRILFYLIGFSAGALIGGAFLHILPEVLETADSTFVFSWLIVGIVLFFLMERFFYWRHCHEHGTCPVHGFTYLNLIGDGFHNFLDGVMIAASYTVSVPVGIATTLAVIMHEVPQELGDFGVLIYGGFSRSRALAFNFLSALMAVLGAVAGYFAAGASEQFASYILPLTAGGFIYIATSDLIPEIHKEKKLRKSTLAFIAFLLGIIFMAVTKLFLKF
ncbi:MAG TPA: ZIP family metal transporter [Candidatus Omnitrophota bacterium]|nr:ZIP family metal transporter [Candidatus Omnitrophota bacterium]